MRFLQSIALSGVLVSFSALVYADNQPVRVAAKVDKVFTIKGFDDNDFIEVVAYGKLPSTCYKLADASGFVNPSTKEVSVKVNALRYDGDICLPMEIPYYKVIELGVMEKGSYNVSAPGSVLDQTSLTVVESASPHVDDYLYAPVSSLAVTEVRAVTDSPLKQVSLRLKGTFPRMLVGCMVIKEIKSYYTPEHVAVILPIAEIKSDEQCVGYKHEFDVLYPLSEKLETPSLFHVRVMNGNAINQILE